MKRKSIIIACVVGAMLMSGCGSESAVESNSSESQTEVEAVDSTEQAQAAEGETSSETQDIAAEAATVDMKDFANDVTEEYGGSLEQSLASALNTNAEVKEDDFESTYSLCNGAIEIYGSANGSGFFVVQNQKVDNFSVYGVSVGMPADEAVKALETQGFKEESGDTTYYAINADDFYISMENDGGTVTKVQYVKVID